jgi:hypothetical protein
MSHLGLDNETLSSQKSEVNPIETIIVSQAEDSCRRPEPIDSKRMLPSRATLGGHDPALQPTRFGFVIKVRSSCNQRQIRAEPMDKRDLNLVVAVTDDDWFEMLRRHQNLNEVNFWAPSAANFRALQPGEMFLFKLHAPRNVIVGGGIFATRMHFRARSLGKHLGKRTAPDRHKKCVPASPAIGAPTQPIGAISR